MKKNNLLYFIISSLIIFTVIYAKILYNIYLHPVEIINAKGEAETLLFGDFKYLFKIINCHNLGFDVYSSNECYSDYYGSFLYGPAILIFPSISQEMSFFLTYFLSSTFILSFIFLTIKIINPDNFLKYLLTSLILFNPTTLFLYEKLNIDILIYIFLIIIVYYSKNILVNFFLIVWLSLIKFYPAIFIGIFLIEKKILKKNLICFFSSLVLFILFIYTFRDKLISVLGTLEYVSQSFRYSFSINALNKIINHVVNFNNLDLLKMILILINFLLAFILYSFSLKKMVNQISFDFNESDKIFILSSVLSISLYLIFNNNFYREIYLIGTIPFILNNYKINFYKYVLYLFIIKYLFLLIFFPYYYNSNLNENMLAQLLIGTKSLLDFIFISTLIASLFLITKIYFKNFNILFGRNDI